LSDGRLRYRVTDGERTRPTAAGDPGTGDPADRVVVSYDESALEERLRTWVARELRGEPYRRYLARVHDTAREGDEWAEFVSRGCGEPVDVRLSVDRVDGGVRLGPGTTVEITTR
jgi:hypothetical protein